MESSTIAIPATTEINYPSLSERIQSTFIDGILIIILMMVFATILDRYENPPEWVKIVLFFGLWAVYEPVCTSVGGTVGNMVKGIRVRSYKEPSKRINIFQAFLRYFIKLFLGWLSFIAIHFNKEKRALHDFAAGSVMISTAK